MSESTGKTPEAPKKPTMVVAAIIVVVLLLVGGLAYYFVSQAGKGKDTFVYYMSTNVLSLDPMDAYDIASWFPISNMYETLVAYPGEDTGNYSGVLAESWSVSPNGMYYNFTLREGVKFSNGNLLTAEDVKFSIERCLQMNSPETGVAWILTQSVDMDSVTVFDDLHFQIKTFRVYAGFIATIVNIYPLGIMDKEYVEAHYTDDDPYAHEFMKYNPMGTGPYMLEEWTPNDQTVLVKNPYYWQGWEGKHVSKVIIKEVTEASTRVQALKSGDADMAEIPLTNIKDVEDDPDLKVDPRRTFQLELVAMDVNTTVPGHDFMRNKLVRQAFSWAFDYTNTSTNFYEGYMEQVQGCIPNGFPLETESQPQKNFTFSLRKASELLNQSGHPLNAQDQRFNGTALKLFADSGDTERTNAAALFKTNLQRLGITVDLTAVSTAVLEATRATRNWDMYMTGWIIDYFDPDDYVWPIAVSEPYWGDYFKTGINNTVNDDAATAAAAELDPVARASLYRTIWAQLNEDPNMIFVGQVNWIGCYSDSVGGLVFNSVTWFSFYSVWFK